MALIDGILAFYNFDGDLTDASGNGRHLADTGGTAVAFPAGKIDSGARFDLGSRATLGSPLVASGTFSFSLFVKPHGGNGIVWSQPHALGSEPQAGQRLIYEDGCFAFHVGSSGLNATSGGVSVEAGQWYHVVGTYDHTTHESRLYVNGANPGGDFNGDGVAAYTGTDFELGWDAGDATLAGFTADLIGFWGRVLTVAEIAQLHNGGAGLNPFTP